MSNMNTELNGKNYKLNEQEDGSIILVPIGEKVKAKPFILGDVYTTSAIGKSRWLVLSPTSAACVSDNDFYAYSRDFNDGNERTLLFNVFDIIDSVDSDYVKKQDVIDALSFTDFAGDSMMTFFYDGSGNDKNESWGVARSASALKALNIL